MTRLRIFLADDHVVVREGLKALINGQPGLEVVGEADNGRAACLRAPDLRPDVIVIDVTMPDVNGIEATRQLRTLLPNVKVLGLTVHEDAGFVRELLQAGASGYVLKRAAASELIHAIQAVARGDVYLDPGIAASFVRQFTAKASRGTAATVGDLSDRETDVLKRIAQGHSNRVIAERLGISVKTVETYKARSMEKLGLAGRADIVRLAIENGWLRDRPDRSPAPAVEAERVRHRVRPSQRP
jgi:DNA-binding NarL/FixJ family response regulator